MTDDNCSDCGLAHHLHIREDGIYECPGDSPISNPLCELCREPMNLHTSTIACPGRRVFALQDALSEYTDSSFRSESPDPLLLAPDKQLPQRHYIALRRSAQPEGVVVPLRRSARLENRRRTREDMEPYPRTQTRGSSNRMAVDPVRVSRSRRMSLQDSRRSHGHSHEDENEALFLGQDYPHRRKSLQPHVLDRMVPVEDMDPIQGFRPFTELDPRQFRHPVTVREPVREIVKPPFGFRWKPSVVVPAVGGMRVRVGQFERRGHPGRNATRSSAADENETCSSSSGSEGYYTALDWSSSSSSTPEHHPSDRDMPSLDTFLDAASPPNSSNPQPEFIQGSSKSALPLQQQTLTGDPRDMHSSSMFSEFPQFDALVQHYVAVQNQKGGVPILQPTPPASCTTEPMPSAPTFILHSLQHPESPRTPCPQWTSYNVAPFFQAPFTPIPMPTAPRPPQIEPSHALAKHNHRTPMPGTLPGATVMDGSTETRPSTPERAETELVVDEVEDWATREPWEYIHRVLTSSTCPLVMFLKTPTGDIPAAAQGALGADLHLQKMLIDNEHWLLIGPRDINLYEFGVRFQTRAATTDKFVFRFGNLNWGADVNQIEDEVYKAVMESSRWGRAAPAALPAQFMAGAMGGLVVWYALSLM